jgi:hypothetical protein
MKNDKSYWQGLDGILRRAIAFVYRRIISSEEEGGMRAFFDVNCPIFKNIREGDEHSIEFTSL